MCCEKTIQIGNTTYKSKGKALEFYKSILNSYQFGESLTNVDFEYILELIQYSDAADLENDTADKAKEFSDIVITDIVVSKVQYGSKSFEVFWSDLTSCYISYRMMVNKRTFTSSELFYIACRNSVQPDITRLKQHFFKVNAIKGFVKCQESGKPSRWEELSVDHRQPNSFSMIVDRFKELSSIKECEIEYEHNERNLLLFQNEELILKFRLYHQDKAALRIIRKEYNASRTFLGRVKRSSRDLVISSEDQDQSNRQTLLRINTRKDELTEAMHSELSISPENELKHRVFTALRAVDIGFSREQVIEIYNVSKEDIEKYEPMYNAIND